MALKLYECVFRLLYLSPVLLGRPTALVLERRCVSWALPRPLNCRGHRRHLSRMPTSRPFRTKEYCRVGVLCLLVLSHRFRGGLRYVVYDWMGEPSVAFRRCRAVVGSIGPKGRSWSSQKFWPSCFMSAQLLYDPFPCRSRTASLTAISSSLVGAIGLPGGVARLLGCSGGSKGAMQSETIMVGAWGGLRCLCAQGFFSAGLGLLGGLSGVEINMAALRFPALSQRGSASCKSEGRCHRQCVQGAFSDRQRAS